MKMHFLAATAATIFLSAAAAATAQTTTPDQTGGLDNRSHPSATSSTQSTTQSGADQGTGMAPAPNKSSMTGHDSSGMRTDNPNGTNLRNTTTHKRHRTMSHTATTPSDSAPGDTDTGGTPH